MLQQLLYDQQLQALTLLFRMHAERTPDMWMNHSEKHRRPSTSQALVMPLLPLLHQLDSPKLLATCYCNNVLEIVLVTAAARTKEQGPSVRVLYTAATEGTVEKEKLHTYLR
jgi:hypothetical protein